ncbi:hypothetical protein T484DRAFT_2180788 [Baffinella frigidus]|nr:hypothetical protein T484DRAFT_2180788 [Cryptophyta sp. CCMP2293]
MADSDDGHQQSRSTAQRTAECTLPDEGEGRNIRQKVGGDGGDGWDEVQLALQLIRDTDGVSSEWHDPEATRQLQPSGWTSFYKNWDKKVLSGAVVPTCVIDFPFADRPTPTNPHGLNLQGDDRHLERMYCFKEVDEDTRVVIHVHTLVRWGDRGKLHPNSRARKVTSVNVRHAKNISGQFQQDGGGFSLGVVPVDGTLRSDWRRRFNRGLGGQLEWVWADPKSFPASENRQRAASSYQEVRGVIKLGESLLQSGALWAETTNLAQTQQIMRGQGEMVECEVVGIAGGQAGGVALSRVRARRALILSVERYESAALAGLANVDNDANLLKRTLQKLGWDVKVVQDAGLDDAEEAIGRFAESVAGSGDACLFAFIGHGAEVSGSVFLVPRDAKFRGEYRETSDLEKHVSRKCIRFAEVQATFARHRGAPSDAEATVFVLDCCRDGMSCAVTGAGRGIGLQKAGAGAAARAEVKNAFVIFSTSSGRVAGDGRAGEGGPFMNVFTSELEKEGQQVTDVTMHTRRRMLASSAQCQLAQDESTLTAHLYFNGHARKSPADTPLTSAEAEPVRRDSRVVYGVDPEDVGAFQARDAELGKLREWAEDRGDASKKRMLVHGLGGMGKTTLGKMFAARAAADGVKEAVLFLSLTDGSCLGVYSGLAEALGAKGDSDFQGMKEEELRALVHRLLMSEEWRGKWVVVLDDLPDPQEERAKWIARDFPFGSGKTLVTSRSPGWAKEGGAGKWEQLALQGMTEEEACAWVVSRRGKWAGDAAGVLELVRKLERLPLAIEQAAAFAEEYFMESPAEYLAAQAESSSALQREWEKRSRSSGEYPWSFAEVISMTCETLEADRRG